MSSRPGVAGLRARLSPAQAALLAKLERGDPAAPARIPRRPTDSPPPVSFAQERLWFLDQLVPGSPAYNLPTVLHLEGPLDPVGIARSIDQVVARHEALRTRFAVVAGRPVQVIEPPRRLGLPVADLSSLPDYRRGAESLRLAREEVERPFDLSRGPLLRLSALRLTEVEHLLVLNVHHIVFDTWSAALFLREMTAFYSGRLAGVPAGLPELPIQYGDFAFWQRQQLETGALARDLAFWKGRLASAPILELPVDRQRPALPSLSGGRRLFYVPPALSTALQALGKRLRTTLFMSLLAGFEALLGRYSGQTDLSTGVPVAGRGRVEIEPLVGFFSNTLVLRNDLSGDPDFAGLLDRVRRVTMEAFAHPELPFERLVAELQPERHASHNPFFQVMLVVQNAPSAAFALPGVQARYLEVHNRTAKFDLWLSFAANGERLFGAVEYAADLFDGTTIDRLVAHLESLLTTATADPSRRLSELSPLRREERHQLLVEWNSTEDSTLARNVPLHQLFEEQVERTPEAIALVVDGISPSPPLTYRELDVLAEKRARTLRSLGVGAASLVGVAMERSREMVVTLLGILKAGGAYVPLDPEYPRERLAFLLDDLGRTRRSPLVLTESPLRALLPARAGVRLLCLDPETDDGAAVPGRRPASVLPAESPAYVIYTSGSTGEPKGVAVPHRGIVNRLLWMQEAYRLDSSDRILQKTPFSFDVSVWEFFWPLITGARLVLARPGGHRDAVYLAHLVATEGITTLHFVPPLLQAFLEVPELARQCARVRRVICSGEALPLELEHRFAALLPGAALHNLYGPTEASVDVTFWRCGEAREGRPVPIGRPIANTALYLLDRELAPIPLGVSGELYIGGIGLALGYLNRPELTAERFVPDLFGRSGERLYRTGDLARSRGDGAIEFLGRLDHQVKVRGFRIELGEIEASLLRHQAVREAVAVVREDRPGHRQLVAYVVPDLGTGPRADTIADEQVADWRHVFDEAYGHEPVGGAADFNIVSWNSSYTGEPIAAEEMREWVDGTVDRILGLRPRRVLEIGCGTGLLLFRIAPSCESYVGTDLSRRALRHVEEQLGRINLPQARVLPATDSLPDLGRDRPDLVVLNSVVQYFPSAGYLEHLLAQAVAAVPSGGAVFVGDVRSLPLLAAFHTSVELHRAVPSTSASELQRLLSQRQSQDRELVLDPAYFRALGRSLPGVSQVEIRLRRGHYVNEMSGYRYDVLFRLGETVETACERLEWDWDGHGLTPERLSQRLRQTEPPVLVVRAVPNARLSGAVRAVELLGRRDPPETVCRLREILAETALPGVDPEDLWALEDELPYDVEITWPDFAADGRYDALFRHRSLGAIPIDWECGPGAERRGSSLPLTNHPLLQKLGERLIPELLRDLGDRLPGYMVPSTLVLLDRLPLSPNGKVARQELPAPRAEGAGDYVAPRNPAEQLFSEIWAEVLGIERVGVTSNFFTLGGDSIHAIQVIARATRRGFPLSPKTMFQHQTVAELAAALGPPAEPALALEGAEPFRLAGELRAWLLAADPLAEDAYPLSPLQQHMLRRYLQAPEPALFLSQMALPLSGPLDRAAFETTWQLLFERNAMLRTYFLWEGLERPYQVVRQGVVPQIEWHDWRDRSPADQEECIEAYFAGERARGFDFGAPPPVRVAVLRTGEASWQVALTVNYACIDGWTTVLLLAQRTAVYRALVAGEEARWDSGTPYRDYIAWVERQDLTAAEEFWRQELQGFSAANPLVARTGSPRSERADLRREYVLLSADLTRGLTQRVRELKVSLNTLFQGAWLLLLGRYCDTDDALCGVAVSGRPPALPGVESIVGSSLNVLPLRARLPADASLQSWLLRLHERQVEISQYEHTPLDRLRRWCAIPEDRPLFESYLVFQNQGTSLTTARELLAEIPRTGKLPYYFAKMEYPLRIDVMPGPQILLSVADYAGIWDSPALRGMAEDLRAMLESFCGESLTRALRDFRT